MNYTKKLIAYFIVNTAVLYGANLLAPEAFVFGRGQIPYWQAILTTSFGLMLAVMIFDLLIFDYGVKLDRTRYILIEALINVGTLYLFARTPLQNSIAVGINAFWIAVGVGLVMSIAQYGAKFFVEHELK